MASNKPTPQHKRLAMGDTVKGYAKGGSIGTGAPVVAKPSGGLPQSPITRAKHANGIPGMKKGGKC
jgi:hypothetical protein